MNFARKPRLIATATLAVATLAVVAACTGGAGRSSASSQFVANGAASSAAIAPQDAQSAAGGSSAGSTAGSSTGLTSVQVGRQLIVSAELTVSVKDVPGAAASAVRIAAALGGTVTGDTRDDGTQHTADILISVPQDSLESALTQLDALRPRAGPPAVDEGRHGRRPDVNSRVTSAQASIARLQELFAKAATVTDLVALENELSQREADLESLEAQQRALAGQTAAATITLHLTEPAPTPAVVHHSGPSGFVSGLRHGWHAFSNAAGHLATALGATLPFLLLAVLVGAGALVLLRRRPARPVLAATVDETPAGS